MLVDLHSRTTLYLAHLHHLGIVRCIATLRYYNMYPKAFVIMTFYVVAAPTKKACIGTYTRMIHHSVFNMISHHYVEIS